MFNAPIFVSGFRPFYFLGSLYAPVLVFYWLVHYLGVSDGTTQTLSPALWSPAIWHGHEMLFGFSAAVVCGFLLTALPGWAGTEEVEGAPLAFLAGLWVLGRVAFWAGSTWSPLIVALADSSLYLFMAVIMAPGLRKAKSPLYWAIIPILLWFLACNLAFHGLVEGVSPQTALAAKIYGLVFLYVIVAGILTPSFTNARLKVVSGREPITFNPWLDWLAVGVAFFYGLSGLIWPGTKLAAVVAIAAVLAHGLRLLRWRAWSVADTPVVFVLHLAYGWLVLSFALRALSDLGLGIPPMAAVHAYTVGALGLMKIGLMTRVVLKHTGRPVEPGAVMITAYALIFFAATIRLIAPFVSSESAMIGLSALTWATAFGLYFVTYGKMLIRPSLPRS